MLLDLKPPQDKSLVDVKSPRAREFFLFHHSKSYLSYEIDKLRKKNNPNLSSAFVDAILGNRALTTAERKATPTV